MTVEPRHALALLSDLDYQSNTSCAIFLKKVFMLINNYLLFYFLLCYFLFDYCFIIFLFASFEFNWLIIPFKWNILQNFFRSYRI